MFRVLILCTGNTARSQMAEALLRQRGGDRIDAASAGSNPGRRVNPLAVEVLEEIGIAWGGRAPREIGGLGQERWDLVITVCDNAREACPVMPGARVMAHWGMGDPAAAGGTEGQRREAFRRARDLLADRIAELLALPLETMEAPDLARAAGRIGSA